MENLLSQKWYNHLKDILRRCESDLTISSPYVSEVGIKFLLDNISGGFKEKGRIFFLTDLSPVNIYQKATNPSALFTLMNNCSEVRLTHLPRLHAKVYISDTSSAIVTSGNLTAGGLYRNFEYGIEINKDEDVLKIKDDIDSYSLLGGKVTIDDISSYCLILEELNVTLIEKENSTSQKVKEQFHTVFRKAQQKLIQLRLSEGATHTVFEKTILYVLKKHGSMPTKQLHDYIEQIHPDLCDASVDRIIDGKRYGKKWKHAVRTAQQHLKKKNIVKLDNGLWHLT